jgi:hypothetical protein
MLKYKTTKEPEITLKAISLKDQLNNGKHACGEYFTKGKMIY